MGTYKNNAFILNSLVIFVCMCVKNQMNVNIQYKVKDQTQCIPNAHKDASFINHSY